MAHVAFLSAARIVTLERSNSGHVHGNGRRSAPSGTCIRLENAHPAAFRRRSRPRRACRTDAACLGVVVQPRASPHQARPHSGRKGFSVAGHCRRLDLMAMFETEDRRRLPSVDLLAAARKPSEDGHCDRFVNCFVTISSHMFPPLASPGQSIKASLKSLPIICGVRIERPIRHDADPGYAASRLRPNATGHWLAALSAPPSCRS